MNSRTVSRKPCTRPGSEKSIAASCLLQRRQRLEVASQHQIELPGRQARALDLAQDGAVIITAVRGGVSVGPVRAVETTRSPQRPQRAVAQRPVQVRAGEIDEDVLALDRVVPEGAVPGNAGVGIDQLQARKALGQVPEVPSARARAKV